ncbi:MAG: RusA family crossover junction endodeoxyribonuclease [Gemmataceae bacterium]
MLTLELPFPPSLNHYYRHIGHATLISRRGRVYRETVIKQVARLRLKPLLGPLDLELELFPPDRRRRDADNFQKCLVDSIQHAGVFKDDSQFVHIEVWKRDPVPGGKAIVRIKEISQDE